MTRHTLLATANHRGDLRYLPFLFTALRRLKVNSSGRVFLLDAGRAWSDESWICLATENRAPYLVMDAMDYYAVCADGLNSSQQEQLQEALQTQLFAPDAEMTLAVGAGQLQFSVDAALAEPEFREGILRLDLPPHGTVRQIILEEMTVLQTTLISVGRENLADPTIAATVELVENEARYYQERKQNSG